MSRARKPASGVPAGGVGRGGAARAYSWPPFEEGNVAGVRHGAYAVVSLRADAEAKAELLRGLVPVHNEADEPAIRMLAVILTRVERGAAALDQAAEEGTQAPASLEKDLRSWINTAAIYLEMLACSPRSRARLGIDLSQLEAAQRRRHGDVRDLSDAELETLDDSWETRRG